MVNARWKMAIGKSRSTERAMSLVEIKVVGAILLIIFLLAFWNMEKAKVRARDVQRKNDLKHVKAALDDYLKATGFYPDSKNGKILACDPKVIPPEESKSGQEEIKFKPCDWALDKIVNPYDTSMVIMDQLPKDPLPHKGHDYIYQSNGSDFQLLASLEEENEIEYNDEVAKRGVLCGQKICNFAVSSSGKVPLDRDISEYQRE